MPVLVIILLIVVFAVFNHRRNAPIRAAKKAEQEEKLRIFRERSAAAKAEMEAYKEGLRPEWVVNECTFKESSGLIALRKDYKAISIAQYNLGQEFHLTDILEIPINEIISARISCDDIKEIYYRTEIIPIGIHNKKSPVGRAIVGSVLLGPIGLVAGAASGLGGKKKIITEERKVQDTRIVKGPLYLTIGCSGQNGILNVSFPGPTNAEHWLNQIRNAKASLGLAPLY